MSMSTVNNSEDSDGLWFQDQHPMMWWLKATNNPDILTMAQAMEASDREKFLDAMLKEVRDHERRGHWRIVHRSQVKALGGRKVFPAVWAMARRRELMTNVIKKWKARLNLGGHRMIEGLDYDMTWSPVVSWPTIRTALVFFLLNDWVTAQLDLVLAYPHAKVDRPTFMEIPRGFHHQRENQMWVLQLLRNLCGGKASGRIYYKFLCRYLAGLGFTQSKFDPCVFYGKDCILLVYVDDLVIGAKNQQVLNDTIEMMKDNVDLDVIGTLEDYVGVHIERTDEGALTFTQPTLIDSILQDLRLDESSKTHATPAPSTTVLHADETGEDHDGHFNYLSVIGKLNYLTKSTRPDLSYSVHQASRFMSNPKKSHALAVKRIGRYLLLTRDKGLIVHPDPSRGFECYVDASFCGEWDKSRTLQAQHDINTARSRIGYVIMFAGVPLTWTSKLATEVVLSSTEAEMVALSLATRENIFMLRLITEAKEMVDLDIDLGGGKIHCTVFEDNMGTIELAKEFRLRPRTKHINVKHWHFNQFMEDNKDLMSIQWIASEDQLADIMTKGLGRELFHKFVKLICGWAVPTKPDTED